MSSTELLVAVAGLAFGYWLVSKLISGRGNPRPGPQPAPEYERQDEPEPQPEFVREPQRSEPAWYEILGVASDASSAQIKHAYRMLMSQYHPDKVATLGDELKRVAERKSKEINLAYEEGMRLRGDRA